jgi:LacI family transcriptional regulator
LVWRPARAGGPSQFVCLTVQAVKTIYKETFYLIKGSSSWRWVGLRAGGELLDLRPRPSAVVCFNDKVAAGVLQAAATRGLRVPDDLSVAGFDDIGVSRATTPRLTTVRQPLQEMGRTAVTMLMRQLDGHAH